MTEKILNPYLSSLPEAKILADLESIRHDLRRVINMTQKWLTIDNSILKDACLTASLMIYRRCFASGVRKSLTREDMAGFGENALKAHDYLIAQASKMVAHSVNSFEQAKVGIGVVDDKIVGVAVMNARKEILGKKGVEKWNRLVQALVSRVMNLRIRKAETTLLRIARSLPLADIKDAPLLPYKVPGPSDAHKRRH